MLLGGVGGGGDDRLLMPLFASPNPHMRDEAAARRAVPPPCVFHCYLLTLCNTGLMKHVSTDECGSGSNLQRLQTHGTFVRITR